MCTIILANGVFGDSVVIAENRDEFYGRDWTPPERTELEDGRWFIAPRDERAGGTWIGVNSEGMVVTVANVYSESTEYDENARSRGHLCVDVLSLSSPSEARGYIEKSVKENDYNGFNLVVALPEDAFCAVYDEELTFLEFEEGFHVVTNSRADEPDEKSRDVSRKVPSSGNRSIDEWIQDVKSLLTDHETGVCVHDGDRGTTSSSIISVSDVSDARTRRKLDYFFAEGHPCESGYESFS